MTSNNLTLKDLMKKINNGQKFKDQYFKENVNNNSNINNGLNNDFGDSPTCMYLDGSSCSEGCSCADIEIEQDCPFIQTGEYDNCCCFKPEIDSEFDDEDI